MADRLEHNKHMVQQATWTRKLYFVYLNKKGEAKEKVVEVYDLLPDGFYGWDLEDEHTKRFKYESMYAPNIGDEFVPRFERTYFKKG